MELLFPFESPSSGNQNQGSFHELKNLLLKKFVTLPRGRRAHKSVNAKRGIELKLKVREKALDTARTDVDIQ